MPSIVRVSPVAVMLSVGAMSEGVPVEVVWPRPAPTCAVRPARQRRAVHVAGAAGHGRSGVDVLGHGVLHEAVRREDGAASRVHVSLARDPLDAAEVVDVTVRVDDPHDRPFAAVLTVESQRRGGRLDADEWVDDEDARLAFDERDVGEVQAAHLVDARHDLEEAVDGVEDGLAPEAGVDAVRGGSLQEGPIGLVVPDDAPVGGLDDAGIQAADEAAPRVLEVRGVVEGEG